MTRLLEARFDDAINLFSYGDLLSAREAPPASSPRSHFGFRIVNSGLVTEVTDPLVFQSHGGVEPLLMSINVRSAALTAAALKPFSVDMYAVTLNWPISVHFMPSAVQMSGLYWIPQLRSDLLDISALPDNWDNEGARAPSLETTVTAKYILEKIISVAIRTAPASAAHAVVLPDGSARFEWTVGDRELFLTVLDNKIEAQRWEPITSVTSVYYKMIDPADVDAELGWLTA